MVIDDKFYMKLAIDEAWKYQLLTYPNPAVGCVIVKNGEILSIEAHKEAGLPHAEINALKSAYLKINPTSHLLSLESSIDIHTFFENNHNDFFHDCDIFVTLEPCNHFGKTPPCSKLLETIKPKRIIISIEDPNKNATGGKQRLKASGIDVHTGILEEEGNNLIYPFLCSLNNGLKVFKIAQRLNGSIDEGYISTKKSLEYVHKIREKIDLLFIGGNTVRTDKPTLDCRFVSNLAPNIYIYSNNNNFDNNIPLFNIAGRDIIISSKLEILDEKKFILLEGGNNLFKKVYNTLSLVLVILSTTKVKDGCSIGGDALFKTLHTSYLNDDLLIWLQPVKIGE